MLATIKERQEEWEEYQRDWEDYKLDKKMNKWMMIFLIIASAYVMWSCGTGI